MTHYAQRENKSAPLSSDFARDFIARRWGEPFTLALLEAMPKYVRGPKKGTVKGRLFWTKTTKGGWVRTGPSYHGSPQGYVATPGVDQLRVSLGYDCPPESGLSPDNWPSGVSDEEKVATWLPRAVADLVAAEKRGRW